LQKGLYYKESLEQAPEKIEASSRQPWSLPVCESRWKSEKTKEEQGQNGILVVKNLRFRPTQVGEASWKSFSVILRGEIDVI